MEMNSVLSFRLIMVGAVVSSGILVGCSPSLSPLYRDYEVAEPDSSLSARITTALHEAGWDTLSSEIPNAIVTRNKTLSRWGLYRVTAQLEVTPLGADHVRVFVHPFREYVTGGRGKIPYLSPSIRAKFLPQLNEALKNHGLVALGTPLERDEDQTASR